MAQQYEITTPVTISGGLTVNGDISIPSNSITASSMTINGIAVANQLSIKTDGATGLMMYDSTGTTLLGRLRTNTNRATVLASEGTLFLRSNGDISANGELVVDQNYVTFNGNSVWHSDNDGAGSGLDADLLDGKDSVHYENILHVQDVRQLPANSGNSTFYDPLPIDIADNSISAYFSEGYPGGTWRSALTVKGWSGSNYAAWQLEGVATTVTDDNFYLRSGINTTWNPWRKIWHDGNDGSGSGLDADKLDGLESSQFLRNDVAGYINGQLTVLNGNNLVLKANSTNTTDSGGIVFADYSGYELGRIWFSAGGTGSIFARAGTSGSYKIWTEQDMGSGSGLDADKLDGLDSTTFVRNDSNNQSVNTGFTMRGSAYVGSSSAGDIIIRDSSGNNAIQISGSNTAQYSSANSYINANGNANFKGIVSLNKLQITDNTMVTNLNAEMVGGTKEKYIAKNQSIEELGGYGVYNGMNVSQQTVPNMSVLVNDGIAYTNSGMRVSVVAMSVALQPASNAYDRYDIIYVQGSSAGNNEGVVAVAEGTPALSPQLPSIPTDAVELAQIRVPVNAGSIQDTNIIDARKWKGLKYINGGIELHDTAFIVDGLSSYGDYIIMDKPIKNSLSSTSLTIPAGQTSITWAHNLNLTNYTLKYMCNSPEPHVYWSNKQSNSIIINLDDICETDVIVDVSIEGF